MTPGRDPGTTMDNSGNILSIETRDAFEAAVEAVCARLKAGDVAALPTETVYGLAANAFDPAAVARIYALKGRPPSNPVIVHVADLEMARACVADWPLQAQRLAEAFWPGPLTLVLRRSERIPAIVTAGGDTVGIRWPLHPFIQAVIRRCGFPLAAPSANRSNQISPTHPEHVRGQWDDPTLLIVDGGQSQVGIESTVLDLTVTPARVLRPGMIRLESLIAVAGDIDLHSGQSGSGPGPLRSPGQLSKHYAPKARLVAWTWRDAGDLERQVAATGIAFSACHVIAHGIILTGGKLAHVCVLPHDSEAYARAFYAQLHQCDAAGAELIVVESVPPDAEWHGVRDRIARASSSG
ncbi:MAG: threonylcarbamoyl-AMP synthase [Verrucomicrobia bacterium]|nr:threonylcarbamoyl-AMP synthase [Verrucomicrobiota bacterium]